MADPTAKQKMAVNSLDHNDDSHPEGPRSDIDSAYQGNTQKAKMMDGTKKKGSFQITSVHLKTSAAAAEDGDIDSVDDFDETHTEDMSSEILDASKTTDVEADAASDETVKSEETKELANLQKNVQPVSQVPEKSTSDAQHLSRFKVVKVESEAPFKRGRWTCLDFRDPPEKSVERTEKQEEVGSGNSSTASSVHYIPGVDDPSKNPLGTSTNLPPVESHTVLEPQPVYPAVIQNGEYLGSIVPPGGQTGANVGAGQTHPASQTGQVTYDQASVPPSQTVIPQQSGTGGHMAELSTSQYMSLPSEQPKQINVQQTVQPQTNLANVPSTAVSASQSTMLDQSSIPTSVTIDSALDTNSHASQSQSTQNISQSQTSSNSVTPQQNKPINDYSQQNVRGIAAATTTNMKQDNMQKPSSTGQDAGYHPRVDSEPRQESHLEGSALGFLTKTNSMMQDLLNPQVLEQNIIGELNPKSNTTNEEGDESGASTVAIDNKIEQAMDLVKSHLMFAVREEVEVLKEQIKELLEKNSQLEYENSLLKASATADTLAQLATPSTQGHSHTGQPPASTS